MQKFYLACVASQGAALYALYMQAYKYSTHKDNRLSSFSFFNTQSSRSR